MLQNQRRIPRFYAVICKNEIGIFTEWNRAQELTIGKRNVNKSFPSYYQALAYLQTHLSDEDFIAFGLDRTKPAFNKIIRRRVDWTQKGTKNG